MKGITFERQWFAGRRGIWAKPFHGTDNSWFFWIALGPFDLRIHTKKDA